MAELDSTNILQTIKLYSQENDVTLGDLFVGMDKKKLGSVTIQEFIQGLQVKFKCYMLHCMQYQVKGTCTFHVLCFSDLHVHISPFNMKLVTRHILDHFLKKLND